MRVDDQRSALRWVLLDGDRYAIVGLLLAGLFAILLGLGRLGVIEVGDPDAVRGIAGGLIPGLFTFLSIVLAINQLVLTQEFGSADEIRGRVQKLRAFRKDVEEHASAPPSPVLPTAFLTVLARSMRSTAVAIEGGLPPDADQDLRQAVTTYTSSVAADARHVEDVLQRSEPGRVNAILSVLEYPDSGQLYEARRIRHEFENGLPSEASGELAELIELLELFSVARTHFRTTYTQRVLARLSRLLLYVGVPAILAAVVLHLMYPLSPPVVERFRLPIVSSLLVVTLTPIAVLFAYILRIATVSERTIAVGPFVSRPAEAGEFGGDDPGGESAP